MMGYFKTYQLLYCIFGILVLITFHKHFKQWIEEGYKSHPELLSECSPEILYIFFCCTCLLFWPLYLAIIIAEIRK